MQHTNDLNGNLLECVCLFFHLHRVVELYCCCAFMYVAANSDFMTESAAAQMLGNNLVHLLLCMRESTMLFPVVADGQVYTWGKNQRGRLGREAEEATHEPNMILFEGMQTVLSVAASHGITLLLTRITAATS